MGENYTGHLQMHDSFPKIDSGTRLGYGPNSNSNSVNRSSKGDQELSKLQDRYGDNRSDLPAYEEDNEYSYNRVRP